MIVSLLLVVVVWIGVVLWCSKYPTRWMQPFDSNANAVMYSYGLNKHIHNGDTWVERCRLPGAARGVLERKSSW